jgi:uncharacterized protein YjbI with pentapeptide repeats
MTIVRRVVVAALVVNTGLVMPVTTRAQQTTTTVQFEFTGNGQTWSVPAGVVQATFDLWGAEGGAVPGAAAGGSGGHTQATLPVTAGSTVNIFVGSVGGAAGGCGNGNLDMQPGGGAGFNGGAGGMQAQCPGAGGGGATDVRIGGLDVSNRVLVAGGGGGAARGDGGCAATGGPGGGLSGGNGQCGHGGSGGNQDGSSGSGQFGFGSTGTGSGPGANIQGGGGGGGGYWGGAGGSMVPFEEAAGGGGGGSAFGPAGSVFETGGHTGNGLAEITYSVVPPPTISSISPAGGPIYGTTTVTITGTSLNSDPVGHPIVYFGSRLATEVQCSSATQCTAISPKGTGTVDVVAEVALVKSASRPFTYNPAPVPITTFRQLLTAQVDVSNIGLQVVSSAADRSALAGTDLHGVNLSGVSFIGEPVDLTGSHLDGATLTGANFALADFSGATLTNISAAGASFEGADFAAQGGAHPAANLSGSNTNLQGADFVNADVSGVKFVGADLTSAVFTGARGVDADFAGVRARNAVFSDAHLYGNGQAFHAATDLENADFTGAVLAGDVDESGGFDFTGAPLTGAHFDDAVCVACNFTNATLNQATFTGAYLPGVALSGAHLSGVNFDKAWLYCGSLANDHCPKVPGSESRWAWPLALGSGETFGPVPFGSTTLTDLSVVSTCPDGKPGAAAPTGCPQVHLLPSPSEQPPLPAPCSASAHGGCPTATTTLFQSSSFGDPLAVVPAVPPRWNTALSGEGYYVAFDDFTVRRISAEAPVIVAGSSGSLCTDPQTPCGDGGPATAAQLAQPSGLAVGLDGSLYIADVLARKVRKVDPSGTITTVAGTGVQCDVGNCGDGGPATSAQLAQPFDVAVDPYGVLLIADGNGGIRRVAADGTISALTPKFVDFYQSVATGADGTVYAATILPDQIVKIDAASGAVTRVVGTGTSGYNGNSQNIGGNDFLLPGTQVQINQPRGLSVDLEGNVVFADSQNHLIRAYVPSSGNVIDDLAGSIVNGAPVGGFNGDGQFSNQTQIHAPLDVTATRGPLFVVADTNNQRVRQVGPAPPDTSEAPEPPEVVVSCRTNATWACERVPKPPDAGSPANLGTVTINHDGVEFAAGRWLTPLDGRVRFLLFEQVPLVPGTYELVFQLAGRGFRRTIQLTQGL